MNKQRMLFAAFISTVGLLTFAGLIFLMGRGLEKFESQFEVSEVDWRLIYEDVEIVQVIEIRRMGDVSARYRIFPSQYIIDPDNRRFPITKDVEWRGESPPEPGDTACLFGLFHLGESIDFHAKPCKEEK